MIIDEEQRFGVVQKEKLKAMRKNIDVLTPHGDAHPRTLHMSLVGVRDMSIIETPPEGRYPIRTYVVEYNGEIIREAILRELDRGGQVYFVYNRIRGIDKMKSHLLELVPHARIVTAHGQMDERHLEQVMLDFLAKGSTTFSFALPSSKRAWISGNVDTLIVCDADRMGLAQMYPAPGPGGGGATGLLMPTLLIGATRSDGRCGEAAAGHPGVYRAGFGLQTGHAGP